MTTGLHDQRLDAVLAVLRANGVSSVVDLGCGDGALLARLVGAPGSGGPAMNRIFGIEDDERALARIPAVVRADARVSLRRGSVLHALPEITREDAVVLVEVIEHLEPSRLHALERAVFAERAPRLVVITTPNADFNPVLGVPAHRMRHKEHRFEWGRTRFRDWSSRVAGRNGYGVAFQDVPAVHPRLGGPTQMAVFDRTD